MLNADKSHCRQNIRTLKKAVLYDLAIVIRHARGCIVHHVVTKFTLMYPLPQPVITRNWNYILV